MKTLLAILILPLLVTAARAGDCPVPRIEAALASSLDGLKKLERDASDVQSAEGGIWQIFREADGRVHSIIRIDAGESGRSERRLSVVNRGTYGIAVTRIDYLRHAFAGSAGPNGTARRATDYYYFCDGRLVVPAQDYAMLDVKTYSAAGADAQRAMILDPDVADFTMGLVR